jgi:hypothetical protein
MGVTRAVLVVLCAVAVARHARADVDWAAGRVTATGIGVADRAAPSPAAARGPARRMAEDAARKQLAAQLPGLPLAAGGTLKAKLSDKAIAGRVAKAVAAALVVDADPQTDGSWKVTMAVPVEAVRMAIAGPRTLGTEEGPAVVVVEGVTAKPGVGYRIGAIEAATLFVKEVPAWAKDAPRAKAKRVKDGAIELDKPVGSESTLFVVVAK